MKDKRIKMHKILVDDGRNLGLAKSFNVFDKYFTTKKSTETFFKWLKDKKFIKGKNKGKTYTDKNLSEFIGTYCCDLTWAKSTQYCGGSGETPTPTDLETITNTEILDKIKTGGKDFWDKIKIGVPSIIGSAGKYFYDKSQDLEKWWEKYKKEHSGGSIDNGGETPSSTDWLKDPTGSKMYVYQLNKDCKWLAKRVSSGKIFNISDNPKYDSSIQILNKAFPDLIKNCNSSSTGTTTASTVINTVDADTTPANLPEWANCLRVIKNLSLSKDSKGEEVVIGPFDKDLGYFWKDMTFLYVSKDGTKVYGKWSCKDNVLVINTDDGEVWMSGSGWKKVQDKSELPDKNFDPTWVDGDDFSSSNDATSSSDKNKPTSLNQNESTMDKLENIISEVNTLITEQTQQIIQAPKDELDILQTSPFLKDKGILTSLCRTSNGTSKPVNVNGKIYYAAKKSFKKGDTTTPYYLTYDGMILKGGDCRFTYALNDKGSPMKIAGMTFFDLDLQYTDILMKFGIDPKNYDTDPYFLINNISMDLKKLVEQGAVSTVFKSWNDMLRYYHPNDYATFALVPLSGGSLNPPTNRGLLAQYMPINGRNYGLNYNDKDVQILFPSNKAPVISGGENQEFTKTDCDAAIIGYLSAAIRYQTRQDKSDNKTINSAENREFIKGCDGSGVYQDLVITPDQLPKVKKDNKVFNFWRGDTLNIKNVYKLLSGKDNNLPAGKNPYLPFIIDRTRNESKTKLDNLIKENLQKLSEEKNNNLLSETKIIQTRTKILTENRILKFKQPREKFFNEIISEAIYLKSQGFDKQIIKEEFWGTLKGLFGKEGSEAIFKTFKEYMGKWLVGKLTSDKPNGWMATSITKSVNEIHNEDLDKIIDCEFITKKVSQSIITNLIDKIGKDDEVGGSISSVVKNGLSGSIDKEQLRRDIEKGVSKQVCPSLGELSKKLEDKAHEMKTKAVQA